jgi:hypothetical protein
MYTITYGYRINCSGTGDYNIKYDCDKSEVLNGFVTLKNILYDKDYSNIKIGINDRISWNITNKNNNNYELGIVSEVLAESFIISDLNGEGAETLQNLKTNYKNLIDQYCRKQSNKTITFIDPEDILIKNTANNILNQSVSNNTFQIAKDIFIWLKKHTTYKTHIGDNNIQPASTTIKKRNGDCDDLSFLYISLCRSIKIPARFIRGYLIEENNEEVDVISHAWAEVFVGGDIGTNGWVPVECSGDSNIESEINQNFGIEDVNHLRLFEDNGSNESLNTSIYGIKMHYSNNMKFELYSFEEINEYNILEIKELSIDESGKRSYI